MSIELVRPDWPAANHVTAFTTTRPGGFSAGAYESLNLGTHVADSLAAVGSNRDLLVKEMDLPATPIWLQQTHSTTVLSLDEHKTSALDQPLPADGAVTSKPGQLCVVLTADCMPLFLCNRAGTQVAVLHAGWRGMADGIIEHGVDMFDDPPQDLLAWAGPTISSRHFEVGLEVKQQLGGSESCYRPSEREQACYADLYKLAGERLLALDVGYYGHSDLCTYAHAKQFYSHRRAQHSEEQQAVRQAGRQTGRMASIIYLQE